VASGGEYGPLVGPGGSLLPLAERQFRLLWLGRVASSIGDVLIPVALAFAVLGLHDSSLDYGLVLASFTTARVALSLVGGVVADRLPRRRVMLASDIVRAVIEAATAGLLFSHLMTLPLFVVTAALFGGASAFFGPASVALIPQTVRSERLQQANALLGMSQSALNVLGPAASGLIIALTHTTAWVFALDAATFVASAVFLAQLRVDEPAPRERASFFAELSIGYREVRARSWVSSALVAFSVSNVCIASFLVLGPVIVRHHGGAGGWGLVAASGALGLFLGGYLSSRARPSHPLAVGFASSALIALPIAALARPLPVPLVALGFAIGMASTEYADTLWETTLQRRIPDLVLARVRSYDQLVSFSFMPVGYLAFGALAQGIGAAPALLGAAGAVAVTNLCVAAVPSVRRLSADEAAPSPAQVVT
jgi:MFS family permease